MLVLCYPFVAHAQTVDFPQAEISSGSVRAKLYLPDPERGYYRGSRFDWSGVIADLRYDNHSYFGVWFKHYDPLLHDAITGPVEEFRSGDAPAGNALGYEQARAGGTFIKIGVGVLRKPDEKPYAFSRAYEIVNHGKWVSRPQRDRVEFRQDLDDGAGFAYRYEKTVRLAANRPELMLEHKLRNTGRRAIETDVYNHDFYVIDGQPTGPEIIVGFPFEARAKDDLKGLAEVKRRELVYLRELQEGQSAAADVIGFTESVADNNIQVENKKSGAGVREIGDRPLTRLHLWSIRTTVCPEAYIHMKIDPGQEFKWTIRYQFYTLPKAISGK